MKMKTVIVEDEPLSREALATILREYCQDYVELVGMASNVEESIRLIKKTNPQLLFLDIKLNSEDEGAFEILKSLPMREFSLIFTTGEKDTDKILRALNHYKAIKYLLKPLSIDEVIDGVHIAKKKLSIQQIEDHINGNARKKQIRPAELPKKISIPIKGGTEYIKGSDIIMFRSSGNNSLVFIKGREPVKSTYNLMYYELNLPEGFFQRTAKSHVVNLTHVEKIMNVDETIYLTDNCQAPLSRKYKEVFIKKLQELGDDF